MTSDFQNWDNDPTEDSGHLRSVVRAPHISPPHIERIFRADDLRRKRRGSLLIAAILLIGVALSICVWLRL
jgi:hypothetical protein